MIQFENRPARVSLRAMAPVASCALAQVDSQARLANKLVCAVGFALRRSKRLFPGPRRDVVIESLAAAVSLLAELADPTPELVRGGGLALLARLAGRQHHEDLGGEALGVDVMVLEDLPAASSETIVDSSALSGEMGQTNIVDSLEDAPVDSLEMRCVGSSYDYMDDDADATPVACPCR